MYLNGLDELDQKIIQLLVKNARMSYSDIGEKIGISRVAVKARIQALENKGIIEEYTTIINLHLCGTNCRHLRYCSKQSMEYRTSPEMGQRKSVVLRSKLHSRHCHQLHCHVG